MLFYYKTCWPSSISNDIHTLKIMLQANGLLIWRFFKWRICNIVLNSMTRAMCKNNKWKRLIDIVGSLLILLCCLPLFILLPIIIILFSGRPVFFLQTRTGAYYSRFTILKFRTMKMATNESNRHIYDWKEGVPDEFLFKTANDSEVTSIGKILRKYSLDELPQLLNVLVGHMSLVGPRPEIPEITSFL